MAWQLALQGKPDADQALRYLASRIDTALGTAEPGGPNWIQGNLALGRLMLADRQPEPAALLLAEVCSKVCAGGHAADAETRTLLPDVLAALEHAMEAAAQWSPAVTSAACFHQAGLPEQAARLLAKGRVALPEPVAAGELCDLLTELGLDTSEARTKVAGLLRRAWDESGAAVAARREAREGYFASALAEVQSLVKNVKDLLEDPLAALGASPGVEDLCEDAADRVARLMEELVAFQPLRPEPCNPRQIVLEVALAEKESLAGEGILLSVAPPEAGEETGAFIDPALTKSLLRGILRAVAAKAGAVGSGTGPGSEATVSVDGRLWDDGRGGRGALFSLWFVPARGEGRRGARRRSGRNGPATAPVEGALSRGTLPDILLRCSGSLAVLPDCCDGRGAGLRICLPSLDPGAGEAADEARVFERAVAELVEGSASPREAAGRLSYAFTGLVRRELEAWGKDLALVLHDLKNSLAFVRDWLREDSFYDSETVRSRCLENIGDLQFWLSEAGAMLKRDGSESYVDLRDIVSRVLRGLAAAMAGRQQTLQLEVKGGPPRVPASPFAAASIVRNLAKNAIEAMPGGGVLQVTVAQDAARSAVSVEFRDQGPGFPEPLLAGSVSPELSDGLHRPHLGLATVRRLLGEQGGRLLLQNDGGGVATALFSTGQGAADLAAGLGGWENLLEDSRRALRAARALCQAGDTETARHLWTAAIGVEAGAAFAGLQTHTLLPLTLEVANGSATRPQPKPALRGAIMRLLGDDAWPRAEAAARRLFARILQGRLDVNELGVAEIALLLLVFAAIGPHERAPLGLGFKSRKEAVHAGAVLFQAAQALEGSGAGDATAALEPLVVAALEVLTSIRLARTVGEDA